MIIQRSLFSSLLICSSILWWWELQSLKWIFLFKNYWLKFNLLVIISLVRIAREYAERSHQTFSRSRRAAAQNEWDSSSSNRTSSFFLYSDFDHRISWRSSFQFVRTMRTKARFFREMLWSKCSEKRNVCQLCLKKWLDAMSTSYEALIFFNLSKVNDFKRDVRDFVICIVFFNATIRDDDNSSSIDCVCVKISYDWVVDWNVISRRSQHSVAAKTNDDAIWLYSRVNKNHEICFCRTKRWSDIILTQISSENKKKREKKKKKKWRTNEKRTWNCDNEVFFYIKKKNFLTLIEDFYDVSLWCDYRTNKNWLLTLRDRWIQWDDELMIFENFENWKISFVDYLDIVRSCVRSNIIDQIIHTWLFSKQFDCMRKYRNEFKRYKLFHMII